MKRIIIYSVITIVIAFCNANAQTMLNAGKNDFGAFKHLDLSLSAGTTGIGLDLSTPISNYLQLRAAFSYIPKFEYEMDFDIIVGEDRSQSKSKFATLSTLLEGMTGYKIDDQITMIGEPTYWNAGIMFDIFPFENKHWYLTAGVYYGPKQIAEAYNKTSDMVSLLAVGMYNNMYNSAVNDKPLFEMGEMTMYLPLEYAEKFIEYGRMGIPLGKYKESGKSYIMEPDVNSMVRTYIHVNRIKPYLGLGYSGRLIPDNDKYAVSMDCGLMFWGGTPQVITHDGTDLTNEVNNVYGKVGDYVDLIKTFTLYPVLNLRISRTLF